jgi:SAM-dependent methyltransferase
MDWGEGESQLSDLSNYRDYQYNLISRHIGQDVLEVGTGDRGFTHTLVSRSPALERLVSIEPSETLFTRYARKFAFPPTVEFHNLDLFELDTDRFGTFDTVVFIHVLEHIERDRAALDHAFALLKPGGHLLIEVPALPWLYSVHDEAIGHYRRYDKPMLRSAVDPDRYRIERLWYQDPIGVLGSYFFFKLRKTKLKSDAGTQLVKNQGAFYDKYLIPFEEKIERFVTFPFGLSLTAVLQRR